jgi:hydrophobe/amphiphile efflux-1 (HAE1) family protein
MQWLAQVCVRRPVFATVLMLLVLVVGVAGYTKLGLDEFPNIDFPVVIVTTRLPGAAPEEIETDVTDKIEGAVSTISGIDELNSRSSEGVSLVVIGFTLEKSVDVAAQDVRDHINLILPQLPKGIDPPIVSKVDPDAVPVLIVALKSNRSIRETTEIADKSVRRQIESINGVGEVSLVGGRKRQVNVWLNPLALQARGLSAADVQRAVAAQNMTTPGGSVETGPQNLTLRVEGRVDSPDAVGRIVVREMNGHAVRVEDVARVDDSEEEERSYAQLDDQQTVVLSIKKQSGTNTVAVVDAVKSRLGAVQSTLPDDVKLQIVRDNSGIIRTGIGAVKEHLVVGAVLAALVVLVFLGNYRSTIIAAVAIPISIIGTFGLMWVQGFTLNFLTLLALALAVGIVIDDAIVVLENITRYIEEKKTKPFPAAVLATREIGLAVLATTLSLMAVFLPVALMSGIVGRFLKSFGMTMAFAIFVSLIVSFSLTPALSARWLEPSEGRAPSRLARFVEAFYAPIERVYMVMLRWSMRHRWVIVAACCATLGSCVPLVGSIPKGFTPPDDRGQFEVNIRVPEGTSVTSTRLIAERIAQDIRRLPGVTQTLLTVAEDALETPNLSRIVVQLSDPRERDIGQLVLMDRVRNEIFSKQPSEYRMTVGEVSGISTGGSSAFISYALAGPDLTRLGEYATKITDALKKVKGAVDVDNSLIVGKPEVRVSIDRERAADLGVLVSDVASTLQLFVGGLKTSSYAEAGEQYDIRVRAEAQYRASPETLALVSVPSSKYGTVALSNVVRMLPAEGPSEIARLGRRRQITITANPAPGVGESLVDTALKKITAEQHLPPSYALQAIGRSKATGDTASNFLLAFSLSFIFMYLVLAAQFESWLHPITILLSLPLTVPFALMSLHLFHQTFNIMSALGLLVLFGVVKKNAILQIDHTNHLRAEGIERNQAILDANRDRLRPILMTTLAFVAGMVPLMLAKGIGAGQDRAIAGVVVGGQTLSLLLTLLATPVAYSLFDDLSAWLKRRLGTKKQTDKGEKELSELLDGPQRVEEPQTHTS